MTAAVDVRAIAALAHHPHVQRGVRATAERVRSIAQTIAHPATARAPGPVWETGAFHDSIHIEPDRGVLPDGGVLVVAGGQVPPRWHPRRGWVSEVTYAALIHTGTARMAARPVLRVAAEQAAADPQVIR